MLSILLDIVYAIVCLLASPFILWRRLFQGRYRGGWAQRFGAAPICEPGKKRIWIHAVSLGEVNAARTLVEQLATHAEIVISTTTDTGMARAKTLFEPSHQVFFYPWDFSFAVRRALQRVRPDVCVLMEGEVWPNFTAVAKRLGVALVVANGRVGGGKGWPRYQKLRWLVKPMFSRLDLVLAQDDVAAERFNYLGVDSKRIETVGSLKYDTATITDQANTTEELTQKLQLDAGAAVWVAGSTGPGEETMLLSVYENLRQMAQLANLRLVIVPRKPERFDEVTTLIAQRELRLLRYSAVKRGDTLGPDADQAIILGDTMGDLRSFYALADVIFVGRSLVPMGGSDMLEAAALSKPVIVGPFNENFLETVRLLVAAKAIEIVPDETQLQQVAARLLTDSSQAAAMGRRAGQVIRDQRGATQRSVTAIKPLFNA